MAVPQLVTITVETFKNEWVCIMYSIMMSLISNKK